MSTRKLYWQDSYRKSFTARVLERLHDPHPGVILNRTVFYATGGGQPHDVGTLAGVRVLDVTSDENGDIIHWLENDLPEDIDEVSGEIDWSRRYDHMQQHSGQHLLSAAFQDILYRPTIGFHLSDNSVTIDLPGPPPDDEAVVRVSDYVQDAIARALPISARIYPPEEAFQLPLRKPPTVSGPVRVIEIQGLDWSACGGTHLRNTSEIGHLVMTRMERRGDQTRVYFLAGEWAYADHLQRIRVTRELSAMLTTSVEDLPDAIQRLQEQMQQNKRALRQARDLVIQAEARRLIAEAPHSGGVDIVFHLIESDDPGELNRLSQALVSVPSVVAVLGWMGNGKGRWIAGRSRNVPLDMLETLEELKAITGVQGGGSPEMIQGGAADEATLHQVLHILQAFAFDIEAVDS